jgi:hypothetical protein
MQSERRIFARMDALEAMIVPEQGTVAHVPMRRRRSVDDVDSAIAEMFPA